MKQICFCLSLLVLQANALVVPNKTHFSGQHLDRMLVEQTKLTEITGTMSINNPNPFMAVIIHGECENMCGGVFLTHKTILTLAECVRKDKSKIKIYPNIPYYLPHCDEEYTLFPIAKVIFMPVADSSELQTLAIVHLEKPVDTVKPIPINLDHFDGKEETILFNLGIDRQLHVDDFDDLQKCQALWPEETPVSCATLRDKGEPHKCTLVPGLPLIVKVKDQSYLKGLLLDPLNCPPKDVIYVNVTSYSAWILLETKPVLRAAVHDLNHYSLEMRTVTHPPIFPNSHSQRTWPFAPPKIDKVTDNSKHSTDTNQVGKGCICNCERSQSNDSHVLYSHENIFIPTERSNNNNNNNNGVKGRINNENKNHNGRNQW